MNTQQGDQRLVYTVQALCLNMDEVELPKDNSICAEHHQDDEHEARYQPVTDVESSYPTAEFCRSVPLHRLVLSSYRSSQAHATTHSFRTRLKPIGQRVSDASDVCSGFDDTLCGRSLLESCDTNQFVLQGFSGFWRAPCAR